MRVQMAATSLGMMKPKLRQAIDKTRAKAGLPVFVGPLVGYKCEKCQRIYYWRAKPKCCPWPECRYEALSLVQ